MSWTTYSEAKASLREFAPYLRRAHTIVKVWSEKHGAYRFCRVFGMAH